MSDQGAPFQIGQAVLDVLKAAPELAGARFLDVRPRQTDLEDGELVVLYMDAMDSQSRESGNAIGRIFAFEAGVLVRNNTARRDAHAAYQCIRKLAASALNAQAMTAMGVKLESVCSEQTVSYGLENIDVGGALIVGRFEVKYRDQRRT